MTRQDFKNRVFMKLAESLSTLSTCSRLKVGAVITSKDNRILSTGYNGRPAGIIHCIEDNPEGLKEDCNCTHAEMNACVFLDGGNRDLKSVYVTAFPCDSCLKLLRAANVDMIYYADPYKYFAVSSALAKKFGMSYERMQKSKRVFRICKG